MTAAELRRRRSAAQLLAGAAAPADPVAAVAHLLAVQAQDLRAARLALRARGAARERGGGRRGPDGRPLARQRLADARHAPSRRARRLRMAARADGAAQRGDEPPPARAARRRCQAAVPALVRALAAEGPLPRAALGERLATAGIRTEGQILPHLLALAAAEGSVVLGPVHDGAQRFALARDWLGPAAARAGARDRAGGARAALPARPRAGHGRRPRGLVGIAAARRPRGAGGDRRRALAATGAGRPRRVAAPPRRLPPRLLGAFDPYLLGWRDRCFAVAPEHARRVHPGGGIVRATAVANGRVVGTWARRRGAVAIEPFEPLPARVAAALRREAADVARFEGAGERQH